MNPTFSFLTMPLRMPAPPQAAELELIALRKQVTILSERSNQFEKQCEVLTKRVRGTPGPEERSEKQEKRQQDQKRQSEQKIKDLEKSNAELVVTLETLRGELSRVKSSLTMEQLESARLQRLMSSASSSSSSSSASAATASGAPAKIDVKSNDNAQPEPESPLFTPTNFSWVAAASSSASSSSSSAAAAAAPLKTLPSLELLLDAAATVGSKGSSGSIASRNKRKK